MKISEQYFILFPKPEGIIKHPFGIANRLMNNTIIMQKGLSAYKISEDELAEHIKFTKENINKI